MKNRILYTLSLFLVFTIQSCKKDAKTTSDNVVVIDSLPANKEFEENGEEYEENDPEEADITYPETGKKAEDFLPKLGIYEIEYDAQGDLNNDGLEDIAIVLKHKDVKTAKRPMLILLQNTDKSYRLDKVSDVVMPSEYNEYDFKLYDTEDISIEKGKLLINLYGMGPSGTLLTTFKYVGKDLVLSYMEAYYSGAGGRSGLTYDFEKGEITETETNTMKEDEPTTSSTTPTKKKIHSFENTAITEFFNEDNNPS
ncbi:hypothetical protein HYN56_14375 [Flavobacterium crocinum]|uniref:Lipoprotein n=1 Tax=Flavobacterium crocinum TaxID=2183896 RepID=A0A2S1YMQ7_9FLAO|nr:hypothetical protein [Flavobacterium crocinum]AWK05355.1 hypothetical protein HYN56_14375 [Flavobacterium crocinum]